MSASISGNKILATASAPATCFSSSIVLKFDGAFVGETQCGSAVNSGCSVTREIGTACKRAGLHTVSATATCYDTSSGACRVGTPGTRSVPVEITGNPTASISASVDASGLVTGTLTYTRPRTGTGQGKIEWWVNSPAGSTLLYQNPYIETPNGTQPISFGTACWAAGTYQIRARVTTCGGDVAETSYGVTIASKMPTASIRPHATDKSKVIVSYSFPNTDDSPPKSVGLYWVHNNVKIWGIENPGSNSVGRSGEVVLGVGACLPDERDMIRVVASVCNAPNTQTYVGDPYKLPACETSCGCPSSNTQSPSPALQVPWIFNTPGQGPSCAGNPVRVTSGNMRLFDHDPLPGSLVAPLARVYDSLRSTGRLGLGWITMFDASLKTASGGLDVLISTEHGERVVFRKENETYRQSWPAAQSAPGSLVYDATAGHYLHRDPGQAVVRVFRGGRLVALRPLGKESEIAITYDSTGAPQRVSDSRGAWAWTVTPRTDGKVQTIGVEGRPDLTWTYQYDTSDRLTSVTSAAGAWRTYTYGAGGLQTARDGGGRLIESHQYDSLKRATTSIGDAGDITGFVYDQPGRVAGETKTRVTYASGRTTDYYSRYIGGQMRTVQIDGSCDCGTDDAVYGFNEEGRLIRQQDEFGYIVEREFADGRVVRERSHLAPSGCDPETDAGHCRLTPDALLAAVLVAAPESKTFSYAYGDPNWPDRPTTITTDSVLAPGQTRTEQYTYDATGAVLESRVTGWSGTPALPQTRVTSSSPYDGVEAAAFNPGGAFDAWATLPQPAGEMKLIDGPRSGVTDATTFVYYPDDASVPALLRGRQAASRNAAGHITRFEAYDVFGHATRVVDPNGVARETTYDSLGRLTVTALRGIPGCDTAADPLCVADIVTEQRYDGTGPLALEINPAGIVSYTYDDRARVKTISRGSSESDLRERIEYIYDPATGKKSVERTLGLDNGAWVEKKRETYTYNTLEDLVAVTHLDGTSVGYTYGAGSRLLSIRDENHTEPNTFYEYDGRSRIKQVTQTLSTATGGVVTTRYGYDRDGNLASVTDPNGNVTTYVYDDFGQMLRQNSPVTGTASYGYDAAGSVLTTTDANGITTTRTYDALSRLQSSVSGAPGSSETITWTYDTAPLGIGRLSTLSDPSGVTSYGYERRGQLVRESKTIGQATYITTHAYDASGNRTATTYPSGRTVTYTFDFAGRPTSATVGSAPLVTSTEYAPFGGATRIVYGNGTTRTTSFDSRYRPLRNELTGPGGPLARYDYSHDAAGNITAIHDALDPAYHRDFHYDDLNRLTTANSGLSLWGNGTYTYDSMGNLKSLALGTKTATFTYSGTTSKLASTNENGTVLGVAYDPAGNESVAGGKQFSYSSRNQLVSDGHYEYVYDGRGIRTVTHAPALFLSLPASVTGTLSAEGRITLPAPAPAGGIVVALTSSAALSVPQSVTITAGSTAATFTATAADVSADTTVTVTATLSGSSVRSIVLVKPAPWAVTAIFFDVAGICPDMPDATGTVTLASAAPAGGAIVTLTADVPPRTLDMPDRVTVPAGATQATFTTRLRDLSRVCPSFDPECGYMSEITARLSATSVTQLGISGGCNILGGEFSTTVPSDPLVSGREATGRVSLPKPAVADTIIELESSDPSVVSIPGHVKINRGMSSAAFVLRAGRTLDRTEVGISASLRHRRRGVTVHVVPTLVDHLETAAEVMAGEMAEVTVVLVEPAPAGGTEVLLSVDGSEGLTAVVEEGSRQRVVSLQMPSDAAGGTALITAVTYGVERRKKITLAPAIAELMALDILPPSGSSGTWTALLTLSGRAPHGGTLVTLATNSDRIVLPAAVVVPEGASAISFELTQVRDVAAAENVTITATTGGSQRSVKVVLAPRPRASLDSLNERVPVALGITAGDLASHTLPAVQRISLYSPELHLLAEIDDPGNGTPQTAYEYLWFHGEPLAQIETATSAIHWYFNDHLGTPILQTDHTATVVWRAEYDPYGNVQTYRTGATKYQPLRFPGQENDGNTERSYNVFRWYRAGWGRYTQADPIGLNGGINLYAYAEDNPINFTDPLGLKVYKCCRYVQVNPFIDLVSRVFGLRHCFLKTDTREGGMGPAADGPLPAWPFGIPTAVRDHRGQSQQSGTTCTEIRGVDEQCVNNALTEGCPTGPWATDNNCNTFVDQVLNRCNPCRQMTRPAPGPADDGRRYF